MNILTFDIEDWFHILDNDSTNDIKNWHKYESRIHKNLDFILSSINQSKHKASFFILGWMVKKYPEIIKKIDSEGYTIGSHTHLHQLIYNQTKNDFKEDVKRSIFEIENSIGKKVKMFRAPGFSITEKNIWAFEVLYELGIEIDSSVFPSIRGHGGFPSFKYSKPSKIKVNGATLKEFPINSINFLGKSFIFSGGGYFRFFPYFMINRWSKKSEYIMSYFHPRDFDPSQPIIKDLSIYRKFKSYYGLKFSKFKYKKWLNNYNFISIDEADKTVDWNNSPIIKL